MAVIPAPTVAGVLPDDGQLRKSRFQLAQRLLRLKSPAVVIRLLV